MKNRRNILKILFVGFVTFIVAACTRNSNQTTTDSQQTMQDQTPVPSESPTAETQNSNNVITTLNNIAVGSTFEFTSSVGTAAILFRSSEDKVYALSKICTHEGCTVDFDMAQNRLICPCHGANYEVSDGSVISGPTSKSLAIVKVKIDGENIVEVI